jgi:hypothetical protein
MAAHKMAAVTVTPPNYFPLGLIRSHMVVIHLFLMLCDLQRVVWDLCPTLYNCTVVIVPNIVHVPTSKSWISTVLDGFKAAHLCLVCSVEDRMWIWLRVRERKVYSSSILACGSGLSLRLVDAANENFRDVIWFYKNLTSLYVHVVGTIFR